MAEKKKQSSNSLWKWLFIALLAVNILIVVWLISIWPSYPVDLADPASTLQTDSMQEDAYVLHMKVEADEAQRMANDYLESINMEDSQVYVSLDNRFHLHGAYEFLGADWPFCLTFDPVVTEGGNVILQVEDLSISNFSIPVGLVMSILDHQLNLPHWIALDSEAETVSLLFNQVVFEDRVQVNMQEIDLENDQIRFDLLLSDDIFQSMEEASESSAN